MRNLLVLTGLLIQLHALFGQQRLRFDIEGAGGSMIYLANYDGNRLYYADSAKADAQGTAVFTPKQAYPAGMYAVLIGSKRFDVLVTEPEVHMSTQADDPVGALRVLRSEENRLYHVERPVLERDPQATRGAMLALAEAHPGTLAAALIRLGVEPDLGNTASLDSAALADRRREHYWDHADLADPRMARVPQFQNRLDAFATLLAKDPIIAARQLDGLIERSAGELRTFLVNWAVTWYSYGTSDESASIFVHLAERHVCTGPLGTRGEQWLPKEKWDGICAKAASKSHVVIGNVARDLKLCDTTGTRWTSLHAMPQSCVVVVFWSPHCGHCKQSLPLMHEKYLEQWKGMDVGVYAVGDARDQTLHADWKSFIREHDLSWVNVGIPASIYGQWKANPSSVVPRLTDQASMRYTETWDANNTPTFYVLDKERRILARPHSIAEVMRAIERYMAED